MTVSVQSRSASHNGDGTTVTFAFGFFIAAAADLTVIRSSADGTETVLSLGTDYTVSGAGETSGGSVTVSVAPVAGETLHLVAVTPVSSSLDLEQGGPFLSGAIEGAVDKLTRIAQEQAETMARAPQVPLGETAPDLPGTADRAGKLLGFSADGSAFAVGADFTIVDQIAPLTAIADDVSTVAALGGAVASLGAVSADVSALGPIASDITTVVGMSGEIQSVNLDPLYHGGRQTGLAAFHLHAADVAANKSGIVHIWITGDSIGGKPDVLRTHLERAIGVRAGIGMSAGQGWSVVSGTAASESSTLWITGALYHAEANTTIEWKPGGVDPFADQAKVFLVEEDGASQVTVRFTLDPGGADTITDVTVDLDNSGAAALRPITYNRPAGNEGKRVNIRIITHDDSKGGARTLPQGWTVTGPADGAAQRWGAMVYNQSVAGLNLDQTAAVSAAGRAFSKAVIQEIGGAHLVFSQWHDAGDGDTDPPESGTQYTNYLNFLEIFEDDNDPPNYGTGFVLQAGPGTGTMATGVEGTVDDGAGGTITRMEYYRRQVRQLERAKTNVAIVDFGKWVSTFAEAVEIGVYTGSDGTHPTALANEAMAGILWEAIGGPLLAANANHPVSVNAPTVRTDRIELGLSNNTREEVANNYLERTPAGGLDAHFDWNYRFYLNDELRFQIRHDTKRVEVAGHIDLMDPADFSSVGARLEYEFNAGVPYWNWNGKDHRNYGKFRSEIVIEDTSEPLLDVARLNAANGGDVDHIHLRRGGDPSTSKELEIHTEGTATDVTAVKLVVDAVEILRVTDGGSVRVDEVELGDGGPKIMALTVDPTAGGGVAAPLGSLGLRDDGAVYRKSGAGNTDWTAL